MEQKCPYCNRINSELPKPVKRFNAHIARCASNPNKPSFHNTDEYRKKQRDIRLLNGCTMSAVSRDAARQRQIDKFNTPGYREAFSARMKIAVANNPDSYSKRNVSGRVKNIEYDGYVFKGNWEYLVGKYLIDNSMVFEQPSRPFPYMWNGKWHMYFPDFYLNNEDLYIEVKGFERERDWCKWRAVSNLVVLRRSEIDLIKRGLFNLREFICQKANQ